MCIPTAITVFVSADLSAARSFESYFDVVTSADIKGKNAWELTGANKLLVPQGEASQFTHQPCLIVLADTSRHAEAAARRVAPTITSPTEAPLLSLEACKKLQASVEASGEASAVGPVSMATTVSRCDAEAALAQAPRRIKGAVRGDGQKAFYMEPSAALAIPGEDNTLTIWGTVQVPSWTHSCVATSTGLARHKFVCNSTPLGGGFGGKLTKSLHVNCAAALATQKSKRSVRFFLNRNVGTALGVGQPPIEKVYEAGFDDTGKLNVVKAVTHGDVGNGNAGAGFSLVREGAADPFHQMSASIPHCLPASTATPPRSWAAVSRSWNVGDIQAESRVRRKDGGREGVQRGEPFAEARCGDRQQHGLVCLYTDDTCLVTMDGSEIGQGINTKVMQYVAHYLSQIVPGSEVSVEDIRVGSNGTDKVAVGSLTGGSTTSEGVCEAVREAIAKLKERLAGGCTVHSACHRLDHKRFW